MNYLYMGQKDSEPDFDALMNSDVLAVDVEATGVKVAKDTILGMSMAYRSDDAYFFPWGHDRIPVNALTDSTKLKVAHNASYDRSMLKRAGVTVDNFACTMTAAHLLWEQPLDLYTLSAYRLGKHLRKVKDIDPEDLSVSTLGEVSCTHSVAALELWRYYEPLLDKWKLSHMFWDIQMPLVNVLSDMELNGILIDRDELAVLGEEFNTKAETLVDGLDSWTGIKNINYNSGDQVARLLFDVLKLPPTRKTGTGKRPSVEAKQLEFLKDKYPIVNLYLKYKQYRKLKDQYVDGLVPLLIDGRLHTSLNQCGTGTGRLSSSDPNLQNIPKRTAEGRRIRKAFVASPGCLLVVPDFIQLELKMMADRSQDEALLDAFRSGRDIHVETAIRAYKSALERFKGKTLNYQVIFGGGSAANQQKFFDAYPGVKKWIDEQTRLLYDSGYARTLHGRIRLLPELEMPAPKIRAHAERQGISTLIQGSSAEVVLIGMINTWNELKNSDARMLLQVHDELVLDVPEKMVGEVVEVLYRTLPYNELSLPLDIEVKVGTNWRDLHLYDGG